MNDMPPRHGLHSHEQKWVRRRVVLGELHAFWRIEAEDGTHIANVPISDNPLINSTEIAKRIAPEDVTA